MKFSLFIFHSQGKNLLDLVILALHSDRYAKKNEWKTIHIIIHFLHFFNLTKNITSSIWWSIRFSLKTILKNKIFSELNKIWRKIQFSIQFKFQKQYFSLEWIFWHQLHYQKIFWRTNASAWHVCENCQFPNYFWFYVGSSYRIFRTLLILYNEINGMARNFTNRFFIFLFEFVSQEHKKYIFHNIAYLPTFLHCFWCGKFSY